MSKNPNKPSLKKQSESVVEGNKGGVSTEKPQRLQVQLEKQLEKQQLYRNPQHGEQEAQMIALQRLATSSMNMAAARYANPITAVSTSTTLHVPTRSEEEKAEQQRHALIAKRYLAKVKAEKQAKADAVTLRKKQLALETAENQEIQDDDKERINNDISNAAVQKENENRSTTDDSMQKPMGTMHGHTQYNASHHEISQNSGNVYGFNQQQQLEHPQFLAEANVPVWGESPQWGSTTMGNVPNVVSLSPHTVPLGSWSSHQAAATMIAHQQHMPIQYATLGVGNMSVSNSNPMKGQLLQQLKAAEIRRKEVEEEARSAENSRKEEEKAAKLRVKEAEEEEAERLRQQYLEMEKNKKHQEELERQNQKIEIEKQKRDQNVKDVKAEFSRQFDSPWHRNQNNEKIQKMQQERLEEQEWLNRKHERRLRLDAENLRQKQQEEKLNQEKLKQDRSNSELDVKIKLQQIANHEQQRLAQWQRENDQQQQFMGAPLQTVPQQQFIGQQMQHQHLLRQQMIAQQQWQQQMAIQMHLQQQQQIAMHMHMQHQLQQQQNTPPLSPQMAKSWADKAKVKSIMRQPPIRKTPGAPDKSTLSRSRYASDAEVSKPVQHKLNVNTVKNERDSTQSSFPPILLFLLTPDGKRNRVQLEGSATLGVLRRYTNSNVFDTKNTNRRFFYRGVELKGTIDEGDKKLIADFKLSNGALVHCW